MIFDLFSNKKRNPIVTELFIRRRKPNIYLIFIIQSYFAVPKNIRLNSTHYFIIKIPNKQEVQQIAFNHLSDIDFKDFMNLYKNYTAKPCSFLVMLLFHQTQPANIDPLDTSKTTPYNISRISTKDPI